MGVRQPADISEMFGKHFNERDKAALLALYTDSALLTIDGTAVARGKAEIDRMVTSFLEGALKMAIKCVTCPSAGRYGAHSLRLEADGTGWSDGDGRFGR